MKCKFILVVITFLIATNGNAAYCPLPNNIKYIDNVGYSGDLSDTGSRGKIILHDNSNKKQGDVNKFEYATMFHHPKIKSRLLLCVYKTNTQETISLKPNNILQISPNVMEKWHGYTTYLKKCEGTSPLDCTFDLV